MVADLNALGKQRVGVPEQIWLEGVCQETDSWEDAYLKLVRFAALRCPARLRRMAGRHRRADDEPEWLDHEEETADIHTEYVMDGVYVNTRIPDELLAARFEDVRIQAGFSRMMTYVRTQDGILDLSTIWRQQWFITPEAQEILCTERTAFPEEWIEKQADSKVGDILCAVQFDSALDRGIEAMGLKPRIMRSLEEQGLFRVGMVLDTTVSQMLKIPRLGWESVREIVEKAFRFLISEKIIAQEDVQRLSSVRRRAQRKTAGSNKQAGQEATDLLFEDDLTDEGFVIFSAQEHASSAGQSSARFGVYYQIYRYTASERDRELLSCLDMDWSFSELMQKRETLPWQGELQEAVDRFMKWASFSLEETVQEVFSRAAPRRREKRAGQILERNEEIVRRRLNGESLSQIGEDYGLSKERVRQIVFSREFRLADAWDRAEYDLFELMFISMDGPENVTYEAAEKWIGIENAELVWLSIRDGQLAGKHWYYDETTDSVMIGERQDAEIVSAILEDLPIIVRTEVLRHMADAAAEEHDISINALWLQISRTYSVSGKFSHRRRLTRQVETAYILQERFPDGYKIANKAHAKRFREALHEEFDDPSESISDHAIDMMVSAAGVLIGRGLYLSPDRVHVDEGVVDEVNQVIENSPRDVIPFSDLFEMMKDTMLKYGIENRYMLQGILHMYGFGYRTGRDYMSKTDGRKIADELSELILKAGRKVTSDEIRQSYPTLNDLTISMILGRCPEIVALPSASYIHRLLLHADPSELEELEQMIRGEVQQGPRNLKVLYEKAIRVCPNFIQVNQIRDYQTFYAVASSLLKDRLAFVGWGFVCTHEIPGAESTLDFLMYWLKDRQSLAIDEAIEISRYIGRSYPSVLGLVESLSPAFVRTSAGQLMRYETLGITSEAEEKLENEVRQGIAQKGWMSAREWKHFTGYPRVRVPWTSFLAEALVNRKCQELGFRRLYILTSTRNIVSTVWVPGDHETDSVESIILETALARQRSAAFSGREELREYLAQCGLCGAKFPDFLERHCITQKDGKIWVSE